MLHKIRRYSGEHVLIVRCYCFLLSLWIKTCVCEYVELGRWDCQVFALRDAGDLAQNATAYVSLEPCNHFGRTPPCTEALIEAKVKKVVVGMVDPNPIVAFKGVERLRDAGIEVVVGVEEELCKSLNEPYIHRMLTGKPFLTLR